MAYEVPDLPYDYDALEPHIDEQTMRIHHDKHHQAYVDKANAALEGTEWADKPVEEVLKNLSSLPAGQAGPGAQQRRRPRQPLAVLDDPRPERRRRRRPASWATAIDSTFGGFDALKKQMIDAGVNRFGSGWSWLVVDGGDLKVTSTANQDSPISDGQTPILGHRRVGARLLPEVPEPPARLPGRDLERHRLVRAWRERYAAGPLGGGHGRSTRHTPRNGGVGPRRCAPPSTIRRGSV